MTGPMNILQDRSIYYAAACFTILYVDITDCAPSPGILGKEERTAFKLTIGDPEILKAPPRINVVQIHKFALSIFLIYNFPLEEIHQLIWQRIMHHGWRTGLAFRIALVK